MSSWIQLHRPNVDKVYLRSEHIVSMEPVNVPIMESPSPCTRLGLVNAMGYDVVETPEAIGQLCACDETFIVFSLQEGDNLN